jgi:peptidoglycan hydrolase CwlO-like protein
MNLDKQEGTIFPGLREYTPPREEHAEREGQEAHPEREVRDEQPAVSRLDWDEEPIRPVAPSRRTYRPVPVRREGGRGSGGTWVALVLLLALLAGAIYYGYGTLQDANIQLSAIPTMLKSLTTVDGRLSDVESQLSAWSRNWQDLTGRMTEMQKKINVDYAKARKHAEVLTAQLTSQVHDLQQQIDARDQAVDARLGQLDETQKASQERIAQLQQQLADARQELASLRNETNGDLATLHQHVAGNDQELGRLNNEVERRRVNFELSKNQITNLSAEVTMDLTATDLRYQHYSGWVYFEPDRRYLWIRQQGVMQPVVFYDAQKSKQYEVVVTAVREGSAVGYLLVPQGSSVVQPDTYVGAPSGK